MNKIASSEVDFWLEYDKYDDYVIDNPLDSDDKSISFNIDLIRLASVRKAISNFVRILTGESIPVYFRSTDNSKNVKGKIVYITSEINTKSDFDVTVGLALHEGAHTLLSNFDVIADMWANLPSKLLKISDSKNIGRETIEKYIHKIFNIIEDRYIDNYVFNTAPGYRGYYAALYDRYWNSSQIDALLTSDDFRYPSLASYLFRICYITNSSTDLTALPRLDEIADLIDISNIGRLKDTSDRINLSFKIIEIILDCIDNQQSFKKPQKVQTLITPEEFFGLTEKSDESESSEDADTKMIHEISDIMSGKKSDSKENENAVNKISEQENKELDKIHKEIVENQNKFLFSKLDKIPVNPNKKELLDLIEQHGIVLVQVGSGLVSDVNTNFKIDSILVHKMTKELIFKGSKVFPLSSVMSMGDDPFPPDDCEKAVSKGISLGIRLGKRLQLRTEAHPIKSLRKKSGRLNKRQLHEASFDCEDLFYKIKIKHHNKATLHISVDASSSMFGPKWLKTMTSVVAICKAASMIDNVHVTVSFRSTQCGTKSNSLPYVVLAYDSKVDKFSKIKNLFPYLIPSGMTPEGLAFESVMKLFEGIIPDELDRYFLNLSDGEPYYHYSEETVHVHYMDDVGVDHTKRQINKIKKKGVNVLSYFIEEDPDDKLKNNFSKMYGKDAKFIQVDEIGGLAYTINNLFLKASDQK